MHIQGALGLCQGARYRQALVNRICALRIQDERDLFQVIPLVTALKLWDLLREFSTLRAKKRTELQGRWAQTLTWIPHHRGGEKSASYWVFLKKWVNWNWGQYYLSHPKLHILFMGWGYVLSSQNSVPHFQWEVGRQIWTGLDHSAGQSTLPLGWTIQWNCGCSSPPSHLFFSTRYWLPQTLVFLHKESDKDILSFRQGVVGKFIRYTGYANLL